MKTQSNEQEIELNLANIAKNYSDPAKARELLEALRWPNGVTCPHCQNKTEKPISKLKPQATSKSGVRDGVYFCGACRKQFTVTVRSIFEGSHIPIAKWLMAIFVVCSSKKSVSAHQMHRMLGVTYKTAWFMLHRIRFAMMEDAPSPKLKGTVEADETFIGGKGELKTTYKRKTPVVALIERGGRMHARVVANVTQKNLGKAVYECVDSKAILNTDEHPGYKVEGGKLARHDTVIHSKFEYARRNKDGSVAHINTCESFFSLLKRGVYGGWHHVSREHLPKYVSEFNFRWDTRKATDGERMEKFVPMIEQKRLTYRQCV